MAVDISDLPVPGKPTDISDLPVPPKPKRQPSTGEKILGYEEPVLEIAGTIGGGILGAEGGPVGSIAGAGLGYGAVKSGEDVLRSALGYPQREGAGKLKTALSDVMYGSELEMGGQIAGKVLGTAKQLFKPSGEPLTEAEKAVKTAKTKVEEAQLSKEKSSREMVKKIHGDALSDADTVETPTEKRYETQKSKVFQDTIENAAKKQREAGKKIQDWQEAFQQKQLSEPGGFWNSAAGKEFRRQKGEQLLSRTPKEAPEFAPVGKDEAAVIQKSMARLQGKPIPGTQKRLPLKAEDLVNEVQRLEAEARALRKTKPGSPKIGYLERQRQDVIKSFEKYVGAEYPAAAYREASTDMNQLAANFGVKKTPFAAGGYKYTANDKRIFGNPELFNQFSEMVGEENANNLAEKYVSNNLKAKTASAAQKWLDSQSWLQESPEVRNKALTYVRDLAVREGDVRTQVAAIKSSEKYISGVKSQLESFGGDKSSVANTIVKTLSGKPTTQIIHDWEELKPSLIKSKVFTPQQIEVMSQQISQASRIADSRQRALAIGKIILGGGLTYEAYRGVTR